VPGGRGITHLPLELWVCPRGHFSTQLPSFSIVCVAGGHIHVFVSGSYVKGILHLALATHIPLIVTDSGPLHSHSFVLALYDKGGRHTGLSSQFFVVGLISFGLLHSHDTLSALRVCPLGQGGGGGGGGGGGLHITFGLKSGIPDVRYTALPSTRG